jgi:uncharacterized protein YqeY
MKIGEKIQADIVVAMKAKDEHRLTTLRMVKSALKNKEIDKRAALTSEEEQQILQTLIKQRKESAESFDKGNRPELAEKERAEIGMIEAYMPHCATEEEIRKIVRGAIDHLQKDAGGVRPGPKDMGTMMTVTKQWIMADGMWADGKCVSDIVKAELAKKDPAEVSEAPAHHASGEEEIRKIVRGAIAHLQKDSGGVKPGLKDIDTATVVAKQWVYSHGLQTEDHRLREIVKAELAK